MTDANSLGPYSDTFTVSGSIGSFSSSNTVTMPIPGKCLLCWQIMNTQPSATILGWRPTAKANVQRIRL
ncbi:hypothetical protein ABIA30_005265 [Mycobacterium sp. MAA66]|uniref:hypothetical protein n=1 Tax=Mycobacterium sp. MAA66 TaxID=3156297 RepID=UPI003512980D